jgi:mannan endo-1,6-alpha-mannosidase
MPKLRESARGAANQCSGGDSKNWCGQNWNSANWDGFKGAGEQMSALAVIQNTLIEKAPKPVTAATGGTSQSDPSAGIYGPKSLPLRVIRKSERTGAAILTVMVAFGMVGAAWWMVGGD